MTRRGALARSGQIERASTPVPVLTTGRGALYQMDCLELLRSIRTESIHCVFADPPFNLDKEYKNGFTDRWSDRAYREWCEAWIDECCRVLVPGGSIFVYSLPKHAYNFAARLEHSMQFRHWIALSMKGTYPRGRRLYPAHYALLYFSKGEPRVFNHVRVSVPVCRHCGKDIKDYGGHRKYLNPAGLNLTDFWEDTSPNRHRGSKSRPGVNELKPMIPSRAIEISTEERDIVFDPFGGGGSTFEAAEMQNRLWIGTELGDCTPIRDRLTKMSALGRKPPAKVLKVFEPS
jgi:DNA methylase